MVDLSFLGLTKYEEAAYLTLVREGISTALHISRTSKVPHGKIYPTLFSLESKGIIKSFAGSPQRFMPLPPKIVIDNYMLQKELELKELKQKSERMITEIGSFASQKENEPLEHVKVVEGYRNYLNLSVSLHEKAKVSWYTISRLPLYQPHLEAYKLCVKKGVEVKILTAITPENKQNIPYWKKTGAQIRVLETLPARFSVIDDSEVMIRISGEGKYLVLWVKSHSLNKSSKAYFEFLWKQAKRIEEVEM